MKRLSKKNQILICVALFAWSAVFIQSTMAQAAQTATLSWTPPTENTDGSALAASDITGYKIYYAVGGDGSTGNLDIFASVIPGVSYIAALNLSPSPDPVTVYFAVTTTTANGESGYSDIGSKTFNVTSTAKPNAPTQLKIEITCDVGCRVTVIP